MDEYLDTIFDDIKLDDNQKKAILDDSKYQMIIAGAGSGKTTTMAAKVKYLVDIKKINPSSILLISFTNKAVDELKERINDDFKIDADIYTFHRLALSILKDVGIKKKIISDDSLVFVAYLEQFIKDNGMKKLKKNFARYVDKKAFKDTKIDINNYNNLYKLVKEFNYFYDGKNLKVSKKEQVVIDFARQYKLFYLTYMDKNNLIDFNGMIEKAIEVVDKCSLNYKYIIVDEYQDISFERYKLLKKLTYKMDSHLIVVGDDWQAIFAFAGSRIDLFMNFKKDMNASCNTIVNTYRNSQELINIAGTFIMKDSKQIKKDLKSSKHIEYPLRLVVYKNEAEKALKIYKIISMLFKEKADTKILLLGRYTFDCAFLFSSSLFEQVDENTVFVKNIDKKVTFLTIHASKGLGFDQVIIINMTSGVFGFPSEKIDDRILRQVKKNDETEERRLFYVALTRTKNMVYLLIPNGKKSAFVNEIAKMSGVKKEKIE